MAPSMRCGVLISLMLTQHAAALAPPNSGPNDRRKARLEQRGLSPQPSMKMVSAPPDAESASSLARRTLLTTNQGCWSGWEVAFDPRTGLAKTLDDAYVAEELREWGQSPLGWETFVEDTTDGNLWQRRGFRVLPEAGCAADEVAVAPFAFGLDLTACRVVATDGLTSADSPRRPSGECANAVGQPFVDVRTIFGASELGDRCRVDVKVDAASLCIVACVVCAETRDTATEPPYSSVPKPGSARAKGLDSSMVSKRCGPCFLSEKDGAAWFGADGSTKLKLVNGLLHVGLVPRAGGGVDVDVSLNGRGLRRAFAENGDVLDLERIS